MAKSCLIDFIEPGTDNVLYDQLFMELYSSVDMKRFNPIKNLIEFLFKQSETCLPGIVLLIFTKLFEILPNFTDSKTLWNSLLAAVISEMTTRIPYMKLYNSLLHSIKIAT